MISAFLSWKPTNSYFHVTVPQQNFSYHIQWGNILTTHSTENSVIAFKAKIKAKIKAVLTSASYTKAKEVHLFCNTSNIIKPSDQDFQLFSN